MKQRANINEVVNETIESVGKVKVVCKLQERLDEVGMNLRELSLLTGIRYATLHELKTKTDQKASFSMQHVLAIMVALRISSFDDLFEIEFETPEQETNYMREQYQFRNNGIPDEYNTKIEENAERLKRTKELRKK